MKNLFMTMVAFGLMNFSVSSAQAQYAYPAQPQYAPQYAVPVQPQYAPPAPAYYTDANGVMYSQDRAYYYDRQAHYWHKVREHKRRRNVLLGVGAVGLITHSPALTVIGLGGAAANEIVDHRHRDY